MSAVYGVRPHMQLTAEEEQPVLMTANMFSVNRSALELYFDCCLECESEGLSNCSCHDEGKSRG